MRNVLVGLVGTVVIGVALSPAPAVAKTAPKTMEFLFQGGDEPFEGTPPVGMSMTGTDFNKPTTVTGFAITGFNWECNGQSVPADVEEVPINRQSGTIGRNEEKDLYFEVHEQIFRGPTLYTYHLWGGQHRKDPRWWLGRVRLVKSTPNGEDVINCVMEGDTAEAGAVLWKARLVKACPRKCKSPF
jgi:hypothetical protein